MSGSMFVVCVPTKEHEIALLEQQEQTRSGCVAPTGIVPATAEVKKLRTLFEDPQGSLLPDVLTGPCDSSGLDVGSIAPSAPPPPPQPSSWAADTLPAPAAPTHLNQVTTALGGLGAPRSRSPSLGHRTSRSLPRGKDAKQGSAEDPLKKQLEHHRFLESELEKVLEEINIKNAVWCKGRSDRYYQVLFSIGHSELTEVVLARLHDRNIGVQPNSVVSVLPCVLYYQGSSSASASTAELHQTADHGAQAGCPGACPSACAADEDDDSSGGDSGIRRTWEQFVQSVRARLSVAQVVEGVRANAAFTFDFLLLLVVAACVATMGLFENSTVILVASMLISPLMGPVMAATFGAMIRDWPLQRMGLVNEFAGLFLCLVIGFIGGLIISCLAGPCPTAEMVDKGSVRSLWVNVIIAVLSGTGIAIALLRDNTGSLIGVAISASLLPPAVNAGVLWSMALLHWTAPEFNGADADLCTSTVYSDRPDLEIAIMASISLCITLINIIFIFFSGILVLWVKEVAPTSHHQRFWKHDVKIARDYNTTLHGSAAAGLLRSLNKAKKFVSDHEDERRTRLSKYRHEPPFGGDAEAAKAVVSVIDNQMTWSPCMRLPPPGAEPPNTVRRLQQLYRTISNQQMETPTSSAANLGKSDGFRGSRLFALARGARGLVGDAEGVVGLVSAMDTPPYDNMPCGGSQCACDSPFAASVSTSAFKTPRGGSAFVDVASPASWVSATFATPKETVMNAPLRSPPPSADEVALPQPSRWRFIVTKPEESTEPLLSPRKK